MIFSPFAGGSAAVDYASSATAAEGDTFDECGGHSSTSPAASYHIHIPPSCLLSQLGQAESTASPQIGWAMDGFPVSQSPQNGRAIGCATTIASSNRRALTRTQRARGLS